MEGDQPRQENAKARRKREKREQEKAINHSVTVLCPLNHRVDNFTLNMIHARFPELNAVPNQTYTLNVKDSCEECKAKKAVYDAKKEQHDQKKAAYEAKNAEKRQAKYESIKENLKSRFRSDQETRLTLHEVHFVYNEVGQQPTLCKASFVAKVVHTEVKIEEDGINATVVTELLPSKNDVMFKKISPVTVPFGLSTTQNKKKRMQVVLKYHQLLRDSKFVRLGGKCGKRCVPPENHPEDEEWVCWEHTLLPRTQVILPNGHLTAIIKPK